MNGRILWIKRVDIEFYDKKIDFNVNVFDKKIKFLLEVLSSGLFFYFGI